MKIVSMLSMNTLPERLLRWVLLSFFVGVYSLCFSQKPVIRQVDKVSGGNEEVISLQGTFINDAAQMHVSFGGADGTVQHVSDQLLEVKVPPGATYENIIVTDKTSGLSDQSDFPFLLSFGGNHGITAASVEGQLDFPSQSGLYDLCTCDFDGDGRVDVATASQTSNYVDVLANTTPLPGLGNISFNRNSFLIGAPSIHSKCGDLNGDGKPDLVVSKDGTDAEDLFVFRNTSSGPGVFTFSIQSVSLPGKKVKRIDIADLDNDGKPEVVVTNLPQDNGQPAIVTVLVNQSTPASISFSSTQLTLDITGAASTDGLVVEDLDGDGLPEIVTSQFLTPTSNIYILRNTSVPGNISFAASQELSLDGTVANVKVADLDDDGKPEIIATQLIGSGTVSIFRNQSSATPSFASPITVATGARPWGIDIGDIDGDGKPDIAVASIEKSITILNNESTPSGLAFSTLVLPTTYINRHIAVADMDGDGKPDIIFTSVDDNNNNITASLVSVFRNKSCVLPSINPAGPLAICTGFPLQLKTTSSKGTTFEWKDGATSLSTGPDAFYDVTGAGDYSVTATGEAGSCVETSNTVTVTVDPGMTTGTAVPSNSGPVCPGGTLALSVNDVGGTVYNWTGPNGYTGTGLTPTVADFQPANAGRYNVQVVVNGCVAQDTSTVVEMIDIPDFQISYTGSDVLCPPATKTLNLIPVDADFTYQWAEKTTGDIAGATSFSVDVGSTGEYYVKAQYTPDPTCAALETEPVSIMFPSPPVADFSAPVTACTSQVVDFVNQSSVDGNVSKSYEWNFGDGQTSVLENSTHQYSIASTYTVTLKVSYDDGACVSQVSKDITIESAPAVVITTPGDNFVVCSGDNLELAVDGTFSSYQWSTGESSPSIFVNYRGTYSVDVTNGTCILTAAVMVDSVAAPVVTATADPAEVNKGQTAQLSATGLTLYQWNPPESLNDPSLPTPVASPAVTTVYTVSGTDDNGCRGEATVEVKVKGDLVTNKLGPAKFISPDNGDMINNYWTVENIIDYPQCSVAIYDSKGIKVYEAKPYNNDWDGTYKGKQLPDGVYYYIIRCDGEEKTPKTGSITVLR